MSSVSTCAGNLEKCLQNGEIPKEKEAFARQTWATIEAGTKAMPGYHAANAILSSVQSALGGLPIAFCHVDGIPEQGLTWARIAKVSPDGTLERQDPNRADGMVYIDHNQQQIVVEHQPYYISLPHP